MTLSASGVAFHAFLALVPLLAAAIAIYGLMADPSDVTSLVDQIPNTVPPDVVALIASQLESIVGAGSGSLGLATAIGIVTGIWSATSGMGNLMEGINIAYDEDTGDRPFWIHRGLAILLTRLTIVFLGVSVALVSVATSPPE